MLSKKRVIFLLIDFKIMILGFKGLVILSEYFFVILKFHEYSFEFFVLLMQLFVRVLFLVELFLDTL